MNYTQFIVRLIELIMADGFHIEDIALNDEHVYGAWASGHTPEHLYNDIWQKDAGNYYKI